MTHRQRVVINGHHSSWLPVTTDIPQGSVLSCSLFILYVDDLLSVVFHSIIKFFADDVTIYWYKEIACSTDDALLQHDLSSIVQLDKTSAVAS